MANDYSKTSPYYSATVFDGKFLDIVSLPVIPKLVDDVLFQVNQTYQYRPDLLAFDLYGDAALWWVFALRNPNTIQDPVFDMKIGSRIYLPKKETISAVIGS
jgi:hypothetical protein